MDNGFEDTDAPGPSLSYDDSVPYADQVASLAERISSTKVYLLSDASKPRRPRPSDDEPANGGDGGGADGEEEMDTDQGTCSLRVACLALHATQQTPHSAQTPSSCTAHPSPTSPPAAYSTTPPTLTSTRSASNGSTTTPAYSSLPQKPKPALRFSRSRNPPPPRCSRKRPPRRS